MQKVICWFALSVASVIAYAIFPDFFDKIFILIRHGEIAVLADYLRSFGWATVGVILVLYIIMTFCLVIPYLILAGACGMIYGIVWGSVIGWGCEMVSAILLFFYGRYFFRSTVERYIKTNHRLQKIDHYAAVNGFMALFFGRLIPVVPSAVLTSVCSISTIRLKDFILATATGIIPAVFVKVMIGHDIIFIKDNVSRLLFLILFLAIVYAVLFWYRRSKGDNGTSMPQKDTM